MPRRSPSPSDAASTATTAGGELTEAEVIEGVQRTAYKDHETLKSIGGRPSREINPDPGPCPTSKSDTDKRYHVSDRWYTEAGRIERELKRWLDFRWHQFETRVDSKGFHKYTVAFHKHQEENGLHCAVELQLGRQTKLDEWREYYMFELRKRHPLEKELVQAKRELAIAEEGVMNAKDNGSTAVPLAALSGRWGELIEYKEKILYAQKEVDMAQKRSEMLRMEEALSAVERDILIAKAAEDLGSAQKRLQAETSEELEQLNRELERRRAQASLTQCQKAVDWVNTRLTQLDALLEWISGQFQYVSCNDGSLHNDDLVEEWKEYYVYMRERLQAKQDRDAEGLQSGWARKQTEVEEARDDRLIPQERVRPLKALLAWIEREFLGTSSRQHKQFNTDNRARTDISCPKPSPDQPAQKVVRKTARCRESVGKRSRLRHVQHSRVFKSSRREKTGAASCAAWPPTDLNKGGQSEVNGLPQVVVRRSEQISQMTHYREPHPLGSIRSLQNSSQRLPGCALRRSARILDHTAKTHSLGPIPDGDFALSTIAVGRKQPRRGIVNGDAAYSRTPQGVSKAMRWKSACKKGSRGN